MECQTVWSPREQTLRRVTDRFDAKSGPSGPDDGRPHALTNSDELFVDGTMDGALNGLDQEITQTVDESPFVSPGWFTSSFEWTHQQCESIEIIDVVISD